jgi:hypothetical protein
LRTLEVKIAFSICLQGERLGDRKQRGIIDR